jgi:flavodoxin
MNTLVTYFSRSGNTEKVAKAIFDELNATKTIKKINDDLKLSDYDLVFLGFPIENYWCPKEIQNFLRNNTECSKIIFFITHGVPETNPLLPKWIKRSKALLPPTAEIIDQFTCQSEVAQYVVNALRKTGKPMQMEWAEHCKHLVGLPDESKLQKAREFARNIQEKYTRNETISEKHLS